MSTYSSTSPRVTSVLRAALYARVSSEQQCKDQTIASQIEALKRRIADDGLECDAELCFVDDGYSGSSLIRPALDRLRDQAAAGAIDRLYVLSPDRLSRKYAYQVLIVEELVRCGVEMVFLNNPLSENPEENLLLQVQGMIAEYERAKIMERSRRGKQHAARRGSVSVFSGAPYGYRYIPKHEGDGEARFQIVASEARVVQNIFGWLAYERCSLREVRRRLQKDGILSPTGKAIWSLTTIGAIVRKTAYKGAATYGRTRNQPLKRKRLRPQRGKPEHPRNAVSRVSTPVEDQIKIQVPAIVGEDLFAAVQAQLEENRLRKRAEPRGDRYLLQGLVVCKRCGYACSANGLQPRKSKGKEPYAYYRCLGSDKFRSGGQRLCWNKMVRTDYLDAAVWEDVRCLLSEPDRIRAEYERRRERKKPAGEREADQLAKLITQVKKSISRLIDAYGDGLLERSEFEPRVTAARERLSRIEQEQNEAATHESQDSELRLVIGQLKEFAGRVCDGLRQPTWATRRQIVRALVKQVEIDENEVRIVYRVGPSARDDGQPRTNMQHCPDREGAKSAKKDHRPAHNLLTMRLMPSLMRMSFQFTRKPSRWSESFR
jgi:site-specific DNA recombinase